MQHTDRIEIIKKKLPELAQELVKQYLDQTKPWNTAFANDLDNPQHHKPEWHQWGILTHTFNFLERYRTEAQGFLKEWGMKEKVDTYFNATIEGIPRSDLIELGILFHDLGKFSKRRVSKKQASIDPDFPDFTFGLHEAESERLLHQNGIYKFLRDTLELTSAHIFYIGRIAALHYELAKIRDRAKYMKFEYSYEFLNSAQYRSDCLHTWRHHPDFGIEIGVLYLGDNLGKTEFRLHPFPTSEDEAASHIWKVIPELERKDIDPRHIAAVITQPLSIYAARKYLEHVWEYKEKNKG